MSDRDKFRVWCHDKNEWEKDEILMHPCGQLFQWGLGVPRPIMGNKHTVEWCVGLKDGRDRLMYDGDIFIAPDQYPFFSDGEHNYVGVIMWCYGAWYYDMVPISDGVRGCACGGMLCDSGDEATQSLEVIGNIHENPELMGQA